MADLRDRIGLEALCEAGVSPIEYAKLAASVGCRHIGMLSCQAAECNPFGYPPWTFVGDPALRREFKSVLADTGVSVSLGEAFAVYPGSDVSSLSGMVEAFHDIGVRRVSCLSFDPDHSRTVDQFAKFGELAKGAGFDLVIEFGPLFATKTMDDCTRLIADAGIDAKILLDVMHFTRAGHTPQDIGRFDPSAFGYVQICDAPLAGEPNYYAEATDERLPPGEGEMPVLEIMKALPGAIFVSAEVPQVSAARAGASAKTRLGAILRATEAILREVEQARSLA